MQCRVAHAIVSPLDWRSKGYYFESQLRRIHCVVSLSKTLMHCLVLVQPRKTCPTMTEKVLTNIKKQPKYHSHLGYEPLSEPGYQSGVPCQMFRSV